MNGLGEPARFLRVMLGVRVASLRKALRESDRGASAVELAVITAMILGIAVILLFAIKAFVTSEQAKITAP